VLAILGYVVLGWATGRAIPAHAMVGTVSVGGLSEPEARLRVADAAPRIEATKVSIRWGATEGAIDPAASGLRIDPDASVAQLLGPTLDPVLLWRRLRGTVDVPLQARIDQGALATSVRAAAATIERPVREGSVSFPGGTVVAQRPQAGRRVDVAATVAAVARSWPGATPVTGSLEEVAPRIDPAAFDVAVRDQAARAVAGPLEVVADGRRATLAPAQFAPALAMVPDAGALTLRVGSRELLAALRTVAPGLEIQPVDATMQLRNGTPALVAARPGRLIDGPTSAETVSRGLVDGSRTAQLTLLDVAPAVTSEQVAGYGITAEIGRATVTIGGAGEPARLSNAALAAKKLTGRLVTPGGQVSFNQSVGPRTPAAGFAATTTRLPGVGTEDEGGVGQVASALYEAAFRAGLVVGPRTAYSVYLPGTAAGLDARVAIGGPDVTVTADREYGVLISAQVSGAAVEVVLYGRAGIASTVTAGTPTGVVRPAPGVDPSLACRPSAGQPGFEISVARIVTADGVEVRRDSVSARYAPVPGVSCG